MATPETPLLTLQAWLDFLAVDWQSVNRSPDWFERTPERIRQVADQLDISVPAPHLFTVAGTNGKGSTCTALAELAITQGRSVGVMTSPHLFRFIERICVNGKPVTEEDVVTAFTRIRAAASACGWTDPGPSQFDYTTLAAVWLFKRAQVEVVVLEVGLGGRLDPVNGFEPTVSIITRVALDHAQWLGNDRETIGREKAGIARHGTPCVIGEASPPLSVVEHAAHIDAPLWIRNRDFDDGHVGLPDGFHLELPASRRGSAGLPQDSLLTAAQAWMVAGFPLSQSTLDRVAVAATMSGSLQQVSTLQREFMLDIAHNPDAVRYLGGEVQRILEERGLQRVLGLFSAQSDKDPVGMLDAAKPWIDHLFACEADNTCHSTETIVDLDVSRGGWVEGRYVKVDEAMEALMAMSQPSDLIVVFGSVSLVAQTLNELVQD